MHHACHLCCEDGWGHIRAACVLLDVRRRTWFTYSLQMVHAQLQVGCAASVQQPGAAHSAHAHPTDRGVPVHRPGAHHLQSAPGAFLKYTADDLQQHSAVDAANAVTLHGWDHNIALCTTGCQWASLSGRAAGRSAGAGSVRGRQQHTGREGFLGSMALPKCCRFENS